MRLSAALALSVALLATAVRAQTEKRPDDSAATSKAPGLKPSSSNAKPRVASPSPQQDTYSGWEFWTNVIIPPGGSLNFDSQMDFSSSDTVRVTLRSENDSLALVVASAYWSVPQLPSFNSAETVTGDTFYYSNVGGATFNCYGSQFRLHITNNGSAPVTLSQVLMFTRLI
jgi:hypothetical protein